MKNILLLGIICLLAHCGQIMAQVVAEAENRISKIINKSVPYYTDVLGHKFIIRSTNSYPPGKLTEMFAKFLLANDLINNKTVADIGCACFPLGVIAAKNGANFIIGADINEDAIQCAKNNLELHGIIERFHLANLDGVAALLPEYSGKVDIIVAGAPWDSITKSEYASLPPERRDISRAFYDVDDSLMRSVMAQGFELLAPCGRVFITSSRRTIARIKKLCLFYKLTCKIVMEEDLNGDGNTHYIVELRRSSRGDPSFD